MDLLPAALTLAICMATLGALPLFVDQLRKQSQTLFLVGTGAMTGICVFDLVPDVYGLGGASALFWMAGAWVAYSVVHSFQFFHHQHDPVQSSEDCGYADPSRFLFFLVPLVVHGFASGMLLTVSKSFSQALAGDVFFALFAHKVYESLMLSSVLYGVHRPRSWKLKMVLVYASALPLGSVVMLAFDQWITPNGVTIISSIAVGTLLGCLFFDFLAPTWRHLRARSAWGMAWVLAGFLLSRVVFR